MPKLPFPFLRRCGVILQFLFLVKREAVPGGAGALGYYFEEEIDAIERPVPAQKTRFPRGNPALCVHPSRNPLRQGRTALPKRNLSARCGDMALPQTEPHILATTLPSLHPGRRALRMALKGKTWVSGDSWRRGVAPHCPPCPWAPCQGPLPSPSSPAVPELFDILQQSPLLLSQESSGKAGAELVYTRVWLTDVCPPAPLGRCRHYNQGLWELQRSEDGRIQLPTVYKGSSQGTP